MKKYLKTILLSGTILMSWLGIMPPTASMTLSGDPDVKTGTADTTIYPGSRLRYTDRDTLNIGPYFRNGQSEETVTPDLRRTWRVLQTLDSSKTIGAPLNDFAGQQDILYAHSDFIDQSWPVEEEINKLSYEQKVEVRACLDALYFTPNSPSTIAGTWSDTEGLISVNQDSAAFSPDYMLNIISHETTHGVQTMHGLTQEPFDWMIRDFQRSNLSLEAAAMTSEYLTAMELGYTSRIYGPWAAEIGDDSVKAARMLDAFATALDSSLPYTQALIKAGETGFWDQFTRQWWLNAYNNSTLSYYIKLTARGYMPKPSGDGYKLERAQFSGYISPEFNFTAGLDSIPTDYTCFGNNTRMRQAFDYADAYRLKTTLGEKSRAYQEALQSLRDDNNPYIGVDMNLVDRVLYVTDGQVRAFEVMNYFSGRISGQPYVAPDKDVNPFLRKQLP